MNGNFKFNQPEWKIKVGSRASLSAFWSAASQPKSTCAINYHHFPIELLCFNFCKLSWKRATPEAFNGLISRWKRINGRVLRFCLHAVERQVHYSERLCKGHEKGLLASAISLMICLDYCPTVPRPNKEQIGRLLMAQKAIRRLRSFIC